MIQKIVMLDFTNLDMPLDTGISQKNMKKAVMTWYLVFGEIIQMLDQLNLKNDVLVRQVR
ncbi:MAG: hypothetical protein EBU66_14905 [Bacteroidetes bacterium]|jgi:hypothetical protein|nr:hypothetical protein [bacterium]NBP65936.1 hypothetical protein [Bacteroidota bacterium]